MMRIVVTEYPNSCEECFFSNCCKYKEGAENVINGCEHLTRVDSEIQAERERYEEKLAESAWYD